MQEEVRRLWKTCFDDPEAFISLYFDKVYREEHTRIARKDGKIVSALQMLPYPMTWHGTEVLAWYISGASTLPEYRGKGIMKELLAGSLGEMHARNGIFSLLIPQDEWLYEYYTRLGYATVFACTPERYDLSSPAPSPLTEIPELSTCLENTNELYAFFNGEMCKRPNCVQHTAADFRVILEDLYLSEGRLFLFREPDGKLGGIAFARPGKEATEVPEMLYRTETAKGELLKSISHHWPNRPVECCTPPRKAHTCKKGMARIINAPAALEIFAATHPETDFRLELRDDLLPSNNSFFRVVHGRCFRIEAGVKTLDLQMDIRKLTGFLFTSPAFISLMLE